jgi:hypothetical protein
VPCYLNINTITICLAGGTRTLFYCVWNNASVLCHSLHIVIKSDILLPAKRLILRKEEIRWEIPEGYRSEPTFYIAFLEQSDQDIPHSRTRKVNIITEYRQLTLSWLTTIQCLLTFCFSKFIISFNNNFIKSIIHELSNERASVIDECGKTTNNSCHDVIPLAILFQSHWQVQTATLHAFLGHAVV